jgi:hypothetical protein
MASSEDVKMELTAESRAIIQRMKHADALPDLRKALIEASDPMVPAVKRAARGLPSVRSRYKTPNGSLRNALANAVKRKVKLTSKRVPLVLITNVPQGGKSNIARAVEGEIPWEHPTFGHNPTVSQEAMPFFYRTLEKYAPIVEQRVRKVLTEFAQKL